MIVGQFIEYKGYIGSIEYNPGDKKAYYGSLLNTKDFVNYCANNLFELEQEYHSAIDDYIAFKEKIKTGETRN